MRPKMTSEELGRIEARAKATNETECVEIWPELLLEIIARLQVAEAIVAKLPKTADGVPMVPKMEIWVWVTGWDEPPRRVVVGAVYSKRVDYMEDYRRFGDIGARFNCCYSTAEAATRAASPSPGAHGGTEGAGKP